MSASVGTPRNHLVRSRYVSTFAHMGDVYAYHDLYGYILKMSPDILDFLWEFEDPADPGKVCSRYANAFEDQAPEAFVGVFLQFHCLVDPMGDELAEIWDAVPVRGAWNVWERHADGRLTFTTAWGDRPIATHELNAEEAAVWDGFDSETKLSALAEEHGRDLVVSVLERLVHHDVQAVKLSQLPLSFYKGRQHMKPPYLTSTMPYAAYRPGVDPAPEPRPEVLTPEMYYRHDVHDADDQFDHLETTLSHLFRRPHPALGGRTYGQSLVAALADRGALDGVEGRAMRVLEVGAGLGKVARAVVEALTERGMDVSYDILELSPALAAAQREELAGLPVQVHEGNVVTDPWPGEGYNLILSNEMIGDLPAATLTHEQARLDDDELRGEPYQEFLTTLGPAGEAIARYEIQIGDAPDPFYINVGAIQFVELLAAGLRPGGTALVTEFGHMARWPVLSTHLDHPELSIHFGHLIQVAQRLELKADYAFVMDLIDMDRDVEGLATTRSYFRALAALLDSHGITLEKIGYTRPMFEELVAGKLDLERIGDLDFRPLENRLMGLVPHEFKALIVQRPAAT